MLLGRYLVWTLMLMGGFMTLPQEAKHLTGDVAGPACRH